MTKQIGTLALVGFIITAFGSVPVAYADPFEDMLGGALGGALIGGLAGGKKGAGAGAAIGGLVGYAHGSSKEQERKRRAQEQRARYERERLELERQRLEEERYYRERQAQQQAARQQQKPAQAGSAQMNLVIELQRSLTVLGYNPGGIDGRMGPATVSAIQAYQQDQSLLTTGQPSEALLAHMRQRGG